MGRRLQNANTCTFKQPKYRSLDGEATESGCVNTVVAC